MIMVSSRNKIKMIIVRYSLRQIPCCEFNEIKRRLTSELL